MLIYGVRESRTSDDVVSNLLELHRMASASADERTFHRRRVMNATHHVSLRSGDQCIFAPVKWCGARKNSIARYPGNKAPVTDQFKPVVISAGFLPITSTDLAYDEIYREYVCYCARYGFTHSNTIDARTFYVRDEDTVGGPSVALTAIDIDEPAGRDHITVSRIIRDSVMAQRVKRLHNYECQICGLAMKLSDGLRYAEAHHVRPLGRPHDGPDIPENILCLCPNHHVELDYGVRRLDPHKIRAVAGHRLSDKFAAYHNEHVLRGA